MSIVDENACRALGLDPKKVASIARRLSNAATEARRMGLTVFGNSGTGLLTTEAPSQLQNARGHLTFVATLDGRFDGGDAFFIDIPNDGES